MARSKQNNGSGLLIDTWYWEYPGIDMVGAMRNPEDRSEEDADDSDSEKKPGIVKGQKVPIEVRLKKAFKETDAPPHVTGAVEFWVGSRELGIGVAGSDIEVLRVALWGLLEKQFEIKWEHYRLVQIGEARTYVGGIETGFALSEATVWKGTAHDGTLLLREVDDYNRTSRGWKYRPWPGEYTNKNGVVVACIPYNDKNAAALKEFRARIRTLQERLAELLKPEVILDTLENLASVRILPAPSQEALDNDG